MLLWVLHAACARLHGLQSSYWVSQPHTPRHLTSLPEGILKDRELPKSSGNNGTPSLAHYERHWSHYPAWRASVCPAAELSLSMLAWNVDD